MNFGAEFLSDEIVETRRGGQLDRKSLVPLHDGKEKRDDVKARISQALRQVEQVVKRLLHVIRTRHVLREGEKNLEARGKGFISRAADSANLPRSKNFVGANSNLHIYKGRGVIVPTIHYER